MIEKLLSLEMQVQELVTHILMTQYILLITCAFERLLSLQMQV